MAMPAAAPMNGPVVALPTIIDQMMAAVSRPSRPTVRKAIAMTVKMAITLTRAEATPIQMYRISWRRFTLTR